MQIPILNGIYTDENADFRTSYPRNMVPVPKQQGISEGYLRPGYGIAQFGIGPGTDFGGINWNGNCYRAMGTKLVRVESDGSVTTLGDIGSSSQVSFDYSFDRLAVAAGGNLYYWNGTTLTQVTDIDLGVVVDFIWIAGYFMTTDGTSLIVTELLDPTAVDPVKYGSSEADPDSVKALIKLRNEAYVLNRYTVEVFQNVGGNGFPFAPVEGAQLMRGTVGTYACAMFMESVAFVGGGRNESPAVWLGSNGSTAKISTREIDQLLKTYTETQLSAVVVEVRVDTNHQLLYVHLPDRTAVYDGAASQIVNEPVWFYLDSSLVGWSKYRARNYVWCYDKWLCGDPTSSRHGYLVDNISSQYDVVNGWDFGTMIVYNEGHGCIFHELELVSLTGRVALGDDPTVWTSYSLDGETWSAWTPKSAGRMGQRLKRLNWLQQGFMRHWRCQRFLGTSDSHMSVARLEARVEALNV